MSEPDKYHCDDHLKGNVKNLGQVCPRCLIAIYNKNSRLLEFVHAMNMRGMPWDGNSEFQNGWAQRVNDVGFEAEKLLKEIGEL